MCQNSSMHLPNSAVSPLATRKLIKQHSYSRAIASYVTRYSATQVAAYHAAPALPRASPSQSERSRFLASLAPPEKRAAGATGVSSERTPKPVVVIGGAPEENYLLVLATS